MVYKPLVLPIDVGAIGNDKVPLTTFGKVVVIGAGGNCC
jgi:hypothetical protein